MTHASFCCRTAYPSDSHLQTHGPPRRPGRQQSSPAALGSTASRSVYSSCKSCLLYLFTYFTVLFTPLFCFTTLFTTAFKVVYSCSLLARHVCRLPAWAGPRAPRACLPAAPAAHSLTWLVAASMQVGSDDEGYAVRLKMAWFLQYCEHPEHGAVDDSPL